MSAKDGVIRISAVAERLFSGQEVRWEIKFEKETELKGRKWGHYVKTLRIVPHS